jgi:cytochrome oxidase Cu insertion factor (SCO1/SenC/PrrC family)
MPGMNSGISPADPTVTAAFRAALAHQGEIALAIFILIALLWATGRALLPGAAAGAGPAGKLARAGEPAARRLLRISFGLLWLLDGVLQAQPQMAAGLPSQVIAPAAAGSPGWVLRLVNWGGSTWSYHPIEAASAAVWIQLGIGIAMIAAPAGLWSRAAGAVSAGWALVVWVFGEAFGGIFAPGLSWLSGAPGSALCYCAAGILVALPASAWRSPRPGRAMAAVTGAFLLAMAVLQAWPGRGFWHGTIGGRPGSLAAMTAPMARTPQPSVIAGWVRAFTAFDEAHGFAVNLFAVAVLAAGGIAMLTAWRRILLPAVTAVVVTCLAAWVLVQDLGVFGGTGTDPNSMIPMALLVIAGYLALTRAPAAAPGAAPAAAGPPRPAAPRLRAPRLRALRPAAVCQAVAGASFSSVASAGALGLILLGAVPMAAARANPDASAILAQSLAGAAEPLNYPAPPFRLTDQDGRTVTLASLRGKVVLLTFLDPVCTSDCPLIAQEFRAAGQLLGTASRHVELVAIAANPVFYQRAYTLAFTRQEGLAQVPDWLFLTGPLPALRQVWAGYGVAAQAEPAGAMAGHTEVAYVIGPSGRVREEFPDDPGPGTAATRSSFAVMLAGAARRYLAKP